ncbi:mitochondrial large subunit ribosomal protein-domain-containing protein [Microdochium bolleyi]|uniref:Large ribosomal subunit protein mL49 n=1 Tax=Microdochium bolleyi TaxID=196109 RepID=A0A136IYK0_9PEZI|nr:mitochondrial large subunit ribosomal protein-domain-containing protein [Microdochium bolleyi]
MLTRTFRPVASILQPTRTLCMRSFATESTPAPELAATIPTTQPAEPAATAAPSEATRARIPYFVGKNKFNNFGVYHKNKRGGNLKTTEIKMVDGNIEALKQDLKASLRLESGDIAFNNTTRHLVVKGHKKPEVLNFLNNMGF